MKALCFSLVLVLAAVASAQSPAAANLHRGTYHVDRSTLAGKRLISPEVHADRTITFRLLAPKASSVKLLFGASNVEPIPLTQDASGLWNATIGPVEPEIYTYAFLVDGTRMIDMSNPKLKTGRGVDASVVELSGTSPRFDETQNVPRGTLHIRSYRSSVLKQLRTIYIYLPPQYDTGRTSFPVLYLRHGTGDTEANWSNDGRAGIILENLLARGKSVPMLIVMTNGDTGDPAASGNTVQGTELLAQELLEDVMPLVEKNYRVNANREQRAIAGLSMGAGQAFTIGLQHLNEFAWVGEFSSGLLSDTDFNLAKYLPGFLDDPETANRRLRILFLSCGEQDPRYGGHLDLLDTLHSRDIHYQWFSTPGAHEWKVWRHSLAEFLQRIFVPN